MNNRIVDTMSILSCKLLCVIVPPMSQGYRHIREAGLALQCVYLRRSEQQPPSPGAAGVGEPWTPDWLPGHYARLFPQAQQNRCGTFSMTKSSGVISTNLPVSKRA